MRAILVASRRSAIDGALAEQPEALLPCVDRPLAHVVLAELVRLGIDTIDILLAWAPDRIEADLGDGERWGCRFRYHLVGDPESPYDALRRLDLSGADGVILADVGVLPHDLRSLGTPPATLLVSASGAPRTTAADWTGWAVVRGGDLTATPIGLRRAGMAQFLVAEGSTGLRVVSGAADRFDTAEALLAAQRRRLDAGGDDLRGRQLQPGVWVEPGARVDPSARLQAPVYIAEGAHIGAGAQLGPHVVVGADSVVDDGVTATESLLTAGTYIGAGLDLTKAIAGGGAITHAGHGITVEGVEAFLVGDLDWRPGDAVGRLWSRMTGAVALVVAAPLLLVTALALRLMRRGPLLHRTEAVRQPGQRRGGTSVTFQLTSFRPPTQDLPAGWRGHAIHLFLDVLPGLVHVAHGDLRLTGIAPASTAQLQAMDDDWRQLRLRAPGGLITDTALRFGPHPSPDQMRCAEMVYAATHGPSVDARLLGTWVAALVPCLRRAPGRPAALVDTRTVAGHIAR